MKLWLESGLYTDDKGNLTEIPVEPVAETVETIKNARAKYHELYYEEP